MVCHLWLQHGDGDDEADFEDSGLQGRDREEFDEDAEERESYDDEAGQDDFVFRGSS